MTTIKTTKRGHMIPLACLRAVKRQGGAWKKTERPEPEAIYIDSVYVVDRSGSMASYHGAPGEAVKTFTEGERKSRVDWGRRYLEMVMFDDVVEIPFTGDIKGLLPSDIKKCVAATQPRGWTKLYDTAIAALTRQRKRVALRSTRLPRALVRMLDLRIHRIFMLYTDGQDNRSFAQAADLKRAITRFESEPGTTSVFAAANQDAFSTGMRLGFQPATILQMGETPAAAAAAFDVGVAAALRGASGGIPAIPQLDRMRSCPTGPYSQQHAAAPPAPPLRRAGGVSAPAPRHVRGDPDSDDDDDVVFGLPQSPSWHNMVYTQAGGRGSSAGHN